MTSASHQSHKVIYRALSILRRPLASPTSRAPGKDGEQQHYLTLFDPSTAATSTLPMIALRFGTVVWLAPFAFSPVHYSVLSDVTTVFPSTGTCMYSTVPPGLAGPFALCAVDVKWRGARARKLEAVKTRSWGSSDNLWACINYADGRGRSLRCSNNWRWVCRRLSWSRHCIAQG